MQYVQILENPIKCMNTQQAKILSLHSHGCVVDRDPAETALFQGIPKNKTNTVAYITEDRPVWERNAISTAKIKPNRINRLNIVCKHANDFDLTLDCCRSSKLYSLQYFLLNFQNNGTAYVCSEHYATLAKGQRQRVRIPK